MSNDYDVMMRMYTPQPTVVPGSREDQYMQAQGARADQYRRAQQQRQQSYLRSPAPVGEDDKMQVELQRTREADAQVEQMTEAQLLNDPTYQRLAGQLYDAFGKNDERLATAPRRGFGGISVGKQTPKDKAEWLTWQMSGFLNSLPKMAWDMSKLKDMPLKDVKAFSEALNMYDNTPLTGKQFMRGVGFALPEMVFGGLGFTLLGRAVTKGVTKNIVKSRLQDIIQRATNAVKDPRNAGMIAGGGYEGGLATGREVIDAEAEQRAFNPIEPAIATTVGATLGRGFGVAVKRGGETAEALSNLNPAPIR